MPNKGRCDPGPLQHGNFKRKQTKHVVKRLAHGVQTLRTPGPNRRAHVLHRGNPGLAQSRGQGQVEIGGVDAHKYLRGLAQKALQQGAPHAHDAAVMPQHLHIATHIKRLRRPPRLHAQRLKHLAPNALHLPRGGARRGLTQQVGCQPIARGLRRYQAYAHAAHDASAQSRAARRPLVKKSASVARRPGPLGRWPPPAAAAAWHLVG